MTEVQSLLKIGDQVKPVDEWDLPEGWSEFQDALKLDGEAVTIDTTKKQAAMVAGIISERDRRMVALASAYTQTERETWHVQTREAEAVLADANAPTPMLTPIAQARGVTVEQMAQHVLGLEAAFAAASGAILAAARVLTDSDPIPADFANDRHWP